MRIGTFLVGGEPHLVVEQEGRRIDLAAARKAEGGRAELWTRDLTALLEAGEEAWDQIKDLIAKAPEGATLAPHARQLAPIPRPRRNVMCVGRNYYEHLLEGGRAYQEKREVGAVPIFFTKAAECVIGPGEPIPAHQSVTAKLDYEAELALVIGRGGRDIAVADALSHVAGYTLLNDVTARDLQRAHQQWFKGKSLDGSCPMGPWLVTADAFAGWPELELTLSINDEPRQRFHTRDMIFGMAELIASLSRGFTLLPGDILATGTGEGCGFAMEPPRFLQPGDRIRIACPALGELDNAVIA